MVTIGIIKWKEGVEADPDYAKIAERMQEIVSGMVGKGVISVEFLGKTSAGEDILLAKYETKEARLAWKNHPEHLIAQQLGRDKYIEHYKIIVAEVIDEHGFSRKSD